MKGEKMNEREFEQRSYGTNRLIDKFKFKHLFGHTQNEDSSFEVIYFGNCYLSRGIWL